jgi:ribonuclease VapC
MIIVDTSVVVAILRSESDAPTFTRILDRSAKSLMSVVSFVEANMVIAGRRRDANLEPLTTLLRALHIDIVSVTMDQGNIAVAAFLMYGKGRNPAALNLADCFSYALAKARNAPLLFKGNDFAQTDIVSASQP